MAEIQIEQAGYAYVASICAKMNAIWRRNPENDLGIDGQIEFLEGNTNISTGKVVAAQVKSGPSYFENETDTHYVHYPTKNQARYWREYSLPVIYIIYNPENDLCYYVTVKNQLTSLEQLNHPKILIPKTNVFNNAARTDIFNVCKDYHNRSFTIEKVLTDLRTLRYNLTNGSITGIDFLIASCYIPGRYFELRPMRIMTLAELINVDNVIDRNENKELEYFLESFILLLSYTYVIEPLNDSYYEQLCSYKLFPYANVLITDFGLDLLEYLMHHAGEYLELDKYSNIDSTDSISAFKEILCKCDQACEDFDRSDRSPDKDMIWFW